MFYFLLLVSFFCTNVSCSKYSNISTTSSSLITSCLPDQTTALLQFKAEFVFIKPNFTSYYYSCPRYNNPYYDADAYESYPKMKFWKKEKDCCSWDGVTCNTKTGKVVALDLSNSWLQGPLCSNSSLFKLNGLRRINLSFNNFSFSTIPSEFGELSSLLHLGRVDFANLIQNMTNLRHLHLRHVDISSSVPESLANLSFLTTLNLGGCNLHGKFPENVFKLHKLAVINVPCNYLLTGILPEFQSPNSLRFVILDCTNFSGKLPNSIGNLNSLTLLTLHECNFVGTPPSSIWNLSQLTYLDLSSNHFSDHVLPSALGNLAKLIILLLQSCQLSGEVPSSLENLTQLEVLSLHNNSFSGQIPSILGNLTKLKDLSLSFNGFSGQIPTSLGKLSELNILDLAHNNLDGVVPSCLFTVPLIELFLSSNQFTGPLTIENISSSQLEPSHLRSTTSQPSIRNKWTGLQVLDMSKNHFSGTIPKWLGSSLEILNVQGNYFNGSIPHEIFTYGSMHNKLRVLDLSHNQFQGRVPQSLINCSKLEVLNVGHNQISDTFPFWLQSLPELQVLVLRSNKFLGPIWQPIKYFGFANLGTIDLSFNHFSGSLPSEYFRNWGYMSKAPHGKNQTWNIWDMELLMEGLKIFVSIDISNNRFDGEIPSSIGKLQSLIMLNLSSNNFTGTIPSSLGNLRRLESLDLSRNKLSGRIPQQLANLTFLAYLNLSHNTLEGPVPQGTQLDTFSYSSFEGNPGLCGSQLPKKCENTDTPIPFLRKDDEEESENGFTWKVVAMGYGCGFVVGAVIGHVTLSRRSSWFWRSFVGRYFYGLW
ncbi:hypothetical protein FNV43_RR02635 [Rhamnella rubrinervis]|uniref:Leucine-rich repeat-containing N-terminal plant-type domain-containing protein n=1 Tax=Rhamnella rubrinervis TaxID=2594499 RepID=A0A8K0MTW9_9ROSA|nr:hypothetical protein FNV43_RR02635 [Rhamnella rubrinervis]